MMKNDDAKKRNIPTGGKVMKKGIALLLVLILILGALLPAASAEESEPVRFTSGDYEYAILGDGTAEIVRYNGTDEEVSIPAAMDGIPVTSIGEAAFFANQSLASVIIPEGVTGIVGWSFAECYNLNSITLPKSLVSIGTYAFY